MWLVIAAVWLGGLDEAPDEAALAAVAAPGRPATTSPATPELPLSAGLEHADLERQLVHMRELVLRLREARPDLFAPGSLGRARPYLPAAQPLDRLAGYLGKELALLEQTVLELTDDDAAPGPGWLRSHEQELHGLRHEYQLDVADGPAFANRSLELVNLGSATVVGPRVARAGEASEVDLPGLVAELRPDEPDPRELARRCFAWVVEHRYHAEPAHAGAESHDPIKLRHVWGYGFCDDSANALATLARAAGLQARVWSLGGHIVPELHYDGGWHVYDVGHEAYYLDVTGRHVASLAELEADPQLLEYPRRLPGRAAWPFELARTQAMYASRDDNQLAGYPELTETHSMRLVLRQGEAVRWSWGHRGARFSDGFYGVPERFGNGRWTWDRPARPDDRLPLELPFELPYPILDGRLVLSPARDAPPTQWRLQLRRPGQPWWPADAPRELDGVLHFALGGLLANGSGEPDYSIELQLLAEPGAALPAAVQVELTFQHAPAALPALQPGRNALVFTSETPEARVRVVHRVAE